MKMLKKFQFGMMVLAIVFLLSACIPGAIAEGATIDATQAAQLVETAVAQALDAQATQLAEVAPQATATLVPVEEATNTPEPIPPTLTLIPTLPVVISTPTTVVIVGSGPVPEYDCDPDIGKRPYDHQEFRPGDSFDIKWTIENTGTATWPAGYDLKYHSGPTMTTHGRVQLGEVKPGETVSVVFDANAPAEKGFQVMTWNIGGFCYPYVAINIK